MKASDLLALIVKERAKEVDVVPEGYLRTEEWAKKWGMERTRAVDLLAYALKQGLVERQTFRIMCGKKRCPVSHFKQLKKG